MFNNSISNKIKNFNPNRLDGLIKITVDNETFYYGTNKEGHLVIKGEFPDIYELNGIELYLNINAFKTLNSLELLKNE